MLCTPTTQAASSARPLAAVHLVPKTGVDLEAILMAVLDIHAPEAEAIHGLTEGIVLVVELNGADDIEDHIGVGPHVKSVDCARVLDDIVTWLALPRVPATTVRKFMA